MKKEQKITKKQPKRSRKANVLGAVRNFDNQFKKYLVTAITAAFAFLLALVWRDAIQEGVNTLITRLGIQVQQAYLYKIYVALFITVVCVLALVFFAKWGAKKD